MRLLTKIARTLILVAAGIVVLFGPRSARAEDVLENRAIICKKNEKGCRKNFSKPFWVIDNLYPGFISYPPTTLTISNKRDENCRLYFESRNIKGSEVLARKINISVTGNNQIKYGGSLEAVNLKPHFLTDLPSRSRQDLLWTVSLGQEVGNELQGQSNVFDLDFDFSCEKESDGQEDKLLNTQILGETSESGCKDLAPGPPTKLEAFEEVNQIRLKWQPPKDEVSYYFVSYGLKPGVEEATNPNIGKQANEVVIGNLSAGVKYYFKVGAGNGCATGQISSEIFAIPKGKRLPNSKPPGFQGEILGKSFAGLDYADNRQVASKNRLGFIFLTLWVCFFIYWRFILKK